MSASPAGTVVHIVLLKRRAIATEADLDRLWRALASLVDEIPGIRAIECGANSSPEGKAQGFEQGFVVRFENAAARDAYLPHPAHLAVVPLVRAVAEEVLVFDLAIAD